MIASLTQLMQIHAPSPPPPIRLKCYKSFQTPTTVRGSLIQVFKLSCHIKTGKFSSFEIPVTNFFGEKNVTGHARVYYMHIPLQHCFSRYKKL